MDETKVPASGHSWQILIALLVVVFIIGMFATFVTLARKGSPVVDVDYYAHGLRYGSDRNLERKGEQQGWRMETVMADGALEVRMRDGRGVPVHGGRLILNLGERTALGDGGGSYAWANGALLTGLERSPGLYTVTLPPQHAEVRHGRLTFTMCDAMLAQKVVILR